ncbi:amidohydrolase family protein [Pseudonocardia sp. TRM90224]|uniref:amidohydrolase family protein n=1 Tax=Pseudonocardia sp. TRM90224 TaxID=2812678 RepID=UPI001E31AD64|nr:amidohydrolase family protein [Pseudonocardia sp. TRM90224]
MAATEKVRGRVVDAHSHIGTMDAWAFYNLKEPVKPTVYEFAGAKDYLGHLDGVGVERGLVLPNYGIPVQGQAFSLNDLVLDAVTSQDRLVGGLWVSILPQNKELTLAALQHAGERGIVALKTTFLLGGNPDPNTWDDDTRELAEACFAAAEEHDLVFHFHTSAGGASDINNFVPLVEKYGKRVKIYLVHFGGGVSGHIKLVPQFLDWVEQGFKVYCDTTWTIGFGARWLMTEIEKRGVGEDRVLFASDEPWSDFWGEYWKINGAPVSDELKQRILYRNYEQLYGEKA